ncbi:MAG: DNA replication and repair protein RecF [Muribaculaceae bacterium]|nr:DNA replication and repair protein RecF [Muribaculaceae bacterium]
MLLKNLTINNFKNIAEARLEFSPKVNCLLGNNGMGKSNLLDAIHYMSFCKSFSGVTDAMLMRREQDFCMIQARYERRGIDEDVSMGMAKGRRKTLKRKGKEYAKLSEHIGKFPLVMVSPQDIDLIRGTSEERRRLMDMVISQGDQLYLDHLIRYNRALEQRNKLLRDGVADHSLYLAVEMTMTFATQYITQARRAWVEELTVMFNRYYSAIAGDGEEVSLAYSTALENGVMLDTLLEGARRHDEIVRHTSVGPHRDDLEMLLSGMPLRRTGSQGQCKTYTIAMRLAQYDFLHKAAGMKPLLLLDDIFDKLDATRVERIMEVVAQPSFGQIFVTDTNRTHLDEIMSRTGGDYRIWEVADGQFTPLTFSAQ